MINCFFLIIVQGWRARKYGGISIARVGSQPQLIDPLATPPQSPLRPWETFRDAQKRRKMMAAFRARENKGVPVNDEDYDMLQSSASDVESSSSGERQ